ncbi:phage tail protein [Actinocrispum wychmicini]|uniref:Phage tail protein n=1 Tax=Actinocrispum wychmicini TaxID=1213861 RepID=A0A4R2JIV2_9PSEU|nr:phage tail protein [Actinocrispum wychmicini]TCO56908.1 hypothetical protein EV192_106383 [Actinocrispum wychmicini]
MTINDNAVLTASRGFIFTAPAGTAAPTAAVIDAFTPTTTLSGWISVGHTSEKDLPEFGFDGGGSEVRGTWANKALRSVETETPVDFVNFTLQQFDSHALELYYGVQNASTEPGVFAVRRTATKMPNQALLIVVVDGPTSIAFYAGKTTIRRQDAVALATDEFGNLPVRATILDDGTADLIRWISLDTGINPVPPTQA